MADEKPNNIFVRRLKDEEQQPKYVSTKTEPHRWYQSFIVLDMSINLL
jgi:hypothetical protein